MKLPQTPQGRRHLVWQGLVYAVVATLFFAGVTIITEDFPLVANLAFAAMVVSFFGGLVQAVCLHVLTRHNPKE